MVGWRYEISLLVLKKYFTRSQYFSTLEEKFRISARPCNILYFFQWISIAVPPLVNFSIPSARKRNKRYLFIYCGQQEEHAILISRLLRMRRKYLPSIRLDFHEEWMECTGRNLITRVWTFYLSQSDHACFDHLSRGNLRKAQRLSMVSSPLY